MLELKETEISTKAVLIGFLVDVGLTFGVSFFTSLVAVLQAFRAGTSFHEMQSKMPELMSSPGWMLINLVVGLGGTYFGGYATGRLAGRDFVLHGAVMGGVAVLFGLVMMAFNEQNTLPTWFLVLATVLTMPAAMAGAKLAEKPDLK